MSLTGASVHDNPSRRRFELSLGEQGVAFLSYRELSAVQSGTPRMPRVLALTHAEVPVAARGGGVAAQLVRGTLDLIRSRGERAAARCAYVVDFVLRHPEYADIIEN
jgi:predicted GNAT family acetyltransferase